MASVHFSIDLLECPVCFNIPSQYLMVFCENGHMVCGNCKNRLVNCIQCQAKFVSKKNILVERILDSVTKHCKYKGSGCNKMVLFKDTEDHARQCEFRPIICFNYR